MEHLLALLRQKQLKPLVRTHQPLVPRPSKIPFCRWRKTRTHTCKPFRLDWGAFPPCREGLKRLKAGARGREAVKVVDGFIIFLLSLCTEGEVEPESCREKGRNHR